MNYKALGLVAAVLLVAPCARLPGDAMPTPTAPIPGATPEGSPPLFAPTPEGSAPLPVPPVGTPPQPLARLTETPPVSRFIVTADEKLRAFLELQRVTRESFRFPNAE